MLNNHISNGFCGGFFLCFPHFLKYKKLRQIFNSSGRSKQSSHVLHADTVCSVRSKPRPDKPDWQPHVLPTQFLSYQFKIWTFQSDLSWKLKNEVKDYIYIHIYNLSSHSTGPNLVSISDLSSNGYTEHLFHFHWAHFLTLAKSASAVLTAPGAAGLTPGSLNKHKLRL